MSVGIVLQARNSSSRYPEKMLHNFFGKTTLQIVIERVKKSKLADKIVLATTDEPIDDILAQIATENEIFVFRGKRDNVLERYFLASKEYKIDTIVRVTCDCPLIDYLVIDKAIDEFLKRKVYYLRVSNIVDGFDVEVFSKKAIKKAYLEARDSFDLEHVTPYMKRFCKKKVAILPISKDDFSKVHISLDYIEDAKNIEFVFEKLGFDFSYTDFLNLLESEPEFYKSLIKR